MRDLAALTHADFLPLEGASFQLPAQVGLELKLASATLLQISHPGSTRAAFSLLFRGSAGLRLAQGIYALKNESLGELEIFITQVADGPQGSEFEAVFT